MCNQREMVDQWSEDLSTTSAIETNFLIIVVIVVSCEYLVVTGFQRCMFNRLFLFRCGKVDILTIKCINVYTDISGLWLKCSTCISVRFLYESLPGPVNYPHKWPVTRKMFPFNDVIMKKMRHDVLVIVWESIPQVSLLVWLTSLYVVKNAKSF